MHWGSTKEDVLVVGNHRGSLEPVVSFHSLKRSGGYEILKFSFWGHVIFCMIFMVESTLCTSCNIVLCMEKNAV